MSSLVCRRVMLVQRCWRAARSGTYEAVSFTFFVASFCAERSLRRWTGVRGEHMGARGGGRRKGRRGRAIRCERGTLRDVRRDVVVLEQIAEDVAQVAVRAAGVEGRVQAAACVVEACLRPPTGDYVSAAAATSRAKEGVRTRLSRSISVAQTMSTPARSCSRAAFSSTAASECVSTATRGLRLSILALAASTRW